MLKELEKWLELHPIAGFSHTSLLSGSPSIGFYRIADFLWKFFTEILSWLPPYETDPVSRVRKREGQLWLLRIFTMML